MSKTANLNIRIDPDIKASAEELFSQFGITISDAVNMFLHQSLNVGGLPFALRQPTPNAETIAAMKEADDIISGKIKAKSYTSAREMIDDILSEADDEC